MWLFALIIACSSSDSEDGHLLISDGDPNSSALDALDAAAAGSESSSSSDASASEGRTKSLMMDAWEHAIIEPKLEELRAGIQIAGPEGLGICEQVAGTKGCATFLGRSPELIPEGVFYFRAIVTAPRESSPWKISFSTECELQHPDGRVQILKPGPQVREVKWKGGTPSTLRLSSFPSPGSVGDRTCTYSLISIRPDGTESEPETGQYVIPGP